ncbi:carboxymuconolactone decarboxylase family protein [Marinovum sp. 2_MG-2023]|uniref:carboxymuconolactone decarboxylase family protein n=1 Tax=unclassified Marinovum TaxID=2647166 RepID=UPI0026E30097|nr:MULTISPECIES: carboxymuconolactone decarboxylase family protein [unclassified Marinovum]MDO6730950.1 carboxymuconolactone decarboxylase family protein [Marinovum sp. 2_MG-2023]MDO6780177.1 carboxymuconolactone decarboxylase family protein [Marinovum sp. 1_MG-2023]
MTPRMNIAALAPDLFRSILDLDRMIRESGLDSQLLHLVKLRASQINGCAYCVDLHSAEALADGIPPQKLHLLAVWRESSLFSEQERAALQWTESLTHIADTGAPDGDFDAVKAVFSESEVGKLTVAIGAINMLNRMGVAARLEHPTR